MSVVFLFKRIFWFLKSKGEKIFPTLPYYEIYENLSQEKYEKMLTKDSSKTCFKSSRLDILVIYLDPFASLLIPIVFLMKI